MEPDSPRSPLHGLTEVIARGLHRLWCDEEGHSYGGEDWDNAALLAEAVYEYQVSLMPVRYVLGWDGSSDLAASTMLWRAS